MAVVNRSDVPASLTLTLVPQGGTPLSRTTSVVGRGTKEWSDVVVYHAATKRENGQVKTVGGRVFGVTALGANLDAAIHRAYEAVGKVSFEGMQFRKDIGQKALARLHAPKA